MARRSTKEGESLRSLNISPSRLEEFAGLSGSEVRTMERAIALHEDPNWVKSQLLRFSAAALLTLEFVVQVGAIDSRVLEKEICQRTSLTSDQFRDVLIELESSLFVIHTSEAPGSFASVTTRAVSESRLHVLELLNGLSASMLRPSDGSVRADDLNARDAAALATLLAHQNLRVNVNGEPNRAHAKALAKRLKMNVEELVARLDDSLQLVEIDSLGKVRLDRAAVHRSLRAQPSATAESVAAWLRVCAPNPVSEAALARAAARGLADQWNAPVRYTEAHAAASLVAGLRGVVRSGGAVAWVPQPDKRLGQGWVTPNLELYLGPGAPAELVVDVGLFAELEQVDQMLRFRLTPASVAVGIRSGLTEALILAALADIGTTPVPENVVAMAREFVSKARVARVTRPWWVELSGTVPEATRAQLVALGSTPLETGHLVPSTVSRAAIEAVLAGAGVKFTSTGVDEEPPSMEWAPRDWNKALDDAPAFALTATADPSLVAIVQRAEALGFAPKPSSTAKEGAATGGAALTQIIKMFEALANGAPEGRPVLRRGALAAARAWREHGQRLLSWADRNGVNPRILADQALVCALLLGVEPKPLRDALQRTSRLTTLLAFAAAARPQDLTPTGREILTMLESGELDGLAPASEDKFDDDFDDDMKEPIPGDWTPQRVRSFCTSLRPGTPIAIHSHARGCEDVTGAFERLMRVGKHEMVVLRIGEEQRTFRVEHLVGAMLVPSKGPSASVDQH